MSPVNPFAATLRILLVAVAVAAVPGLAHADWRKAETRHFTVFSDGSERSLREYAIELERIDQLMRTYFALPGSEGDRPLPVYLVGDRRAMAIAQPGLPSSTAGVYSANFRDIRAIAIRSLGDEIVRHEYGHHFMYRNFPGAYPAWFREGFAEFFMTATVTADGRATVGRSSPMRIQTLNSVRWLPMGEVLSSGFDETRRTQRAAFYAQSWLLMHWVLTDPERRRRMDGYLADTARGATIETALRTHFDMSIEDLDRTLRAYFRSGTRFAELDLDGAGPPAVTVTALPDSADDLMLLDLNARNGGPADEGTELLASIREAAARHPGDALAQTALARVEILWGDPAAGERAIRPFLETRPDNVELLLLMAEARMAAGDKQTDPEAREPLLRQARGFLARAYAADPGDHRVYQGSAHSRRAAPDYPNANDVELWRRAVAIAPQIASNRPVAAEAMLRHGLVDEAERVIQPIANDPHGGEISPRIQRILDQIAQHRANAPAAD